jgi:hypothetical protein
MMKDHIKACGFRLTDAPLTWARRLDANGKAAAVYLAKQLEEETG